MDLSELKYKITRLAFFIGSFKYKRNKNLYISFFLIAVLISSTAFGIYLFQKNEITKKENILKSYFAELEGKNPSNNADARNYENSGTVPNTNVTDDTGSNPVVNTDKNSVISTSRNGDGNNQTGSDAGSGSQIKTGDASIKIKTYICGSVKNPGVYELGSDARIEELLKACGGASENACLEAVNLAKKLSDGEMVYIPSIEEVAKDGSFYNYISGFIKDGHSGSGDQNDTETKIININIATAQEFESLPGIGETIAQDIISYREKYGLFKSKEELKNVKGIGDIKFEKIKELISI